MAEYIEREALYRNIAELEMLARDRYLDTPTSSPVYPRYLAQLGERTHLKFLVADFPAADVAPVVHGKWGKPIKVDADNVGYKCSNCGEFGAPCWNFCPYCGANMEGKSDEV